MNITLTQLKCAMPKIGVLAIAYLPCLNSAMAEFHIDTKPRQARFLAQLAHETGQLARVVENLNYTPAALLATFNSKVVRITPAQAALYGRTDAHPADQVAIANTVYANRMGNGDAASGDGWRYRGAGGFQLTGKANQLECAAYFRIPADKIGDWLRTPEGVCRSAAWYWWKTGLNTLADAGKDDAISDLVNIGRRTDKVGDSIGWGERIALTNNNLKVLA